MTSSSKKKNPRIINVLNAPSPAATASLNVGDVIASKLEPKL